MRLYSGDVKGRCHNHSVQHMHVRTKYWEYNKKISGITIVNSGVNIKRVYRMQLPVVRLKFSLI